MSTGCGFENGSSEVDFGTDTATERVVEERVSGSGVAKERASGKGCQ